MAETKKSTESMTIEVDLTKGFIDEIVRATLPLSKKKKDISQFREEYGLSLAKKLTEAVLRGNTINNYDPSYHGDDPNVKDDNYELDLLVEANLLNKGKLIGQSHMRHQSWFEFTPTKRGLLLYIAHNYLI